MDNIRYEGFFLDLYLMSHLALNSDFKEIAHKHITTEYMPKITHKHLYGKRATFRILGYGFDGINEGLSVELINAENPKLTDLYKGIKIPHITLSVRNDGKSVNTANLEFHQVSPIIIHCTFGGYTKNGPIFE